MAENSTPTTQVQTDNYICPNCGGTMQHNIQKDRFLCTACGYEGELHTGDSRVQEYDFSGYAAREAQSVAFVGMAVANCQSCGGQITFEENMTATTCPMCGSTQIAQAKQRAGIAPEGIIPFKVDKQEAGRKFHEWVKGLWFAPNKLKKSYQSGSFTGRFVPFWTYDADSFASYTGEGGRYRRVKDKDGKERTETDWYPTSGTVQKSFDDILVPAARGDGAQDANGVAPFDTIHELRPYAPEYLAGYRAELYSVKADVGFQTAKQQMEAELHSMAESDICRRFDTSRFVRISPRFTNVTYKHVLLPVWCSVFAYAGKTYRCAINGVTGKVNGDRPYSAIKIIAAILVTVALIAGAFTMCTGGEEASYEALPVEEATLEEAGLELPSEQLYTRALVPMEG